MYQYSFNEDESEDIQKQTENYSNLLEKFKAIDDKYSSNDSGPLNLQKMEYTKPTDEEIKKKAEDSLVSYKEKSLSEIENDYNDDKTSVEGQIKELETSKDEKLDKITTQYNNLEKQAGNSAVKKGISRSSIVINILDAFKDEKVKEYNKLNEEITTKLNSLNSQKDLLETQRQSALNSFDLAYAVKLSDKIDSINADILKQEQTVIKYNNEIAEKEAKYENTRKENAQKYAEYIAKNGLNGITLAKQEEKYELAKEYLLSLPKEMAIKQLEENEFFSSELGSKNYSKLKLMLEN